MMKAFNDEFFEKYITNQLSEGDRSSFENSLITDPILKTDFEFYLNLKTAAKQIHRDEIRAELNDFELKSIPQKTAVFSLTKKLLAIAAIFFAGVIVFKVFTDNMQSKDLYSQYYEAYSINEYRGEIELNESIELYRVEKFDEFLESTKTIENKSNPNEWNLLKAIAALEINDLDQAEKHLFQIDEESSFRDKRYWYRSLLLIKQQQFDQARLLLEKLKQTSNYKIEEVNNILKMI